MIVNVCMRVAVFSSLVALVAQGCGDGKGSNEATSGAGSSAVSASGGRGGAAETKGGAGAGGSAGSRAPTPPPAMPRALGPADGILCQSTFDPPPQTCSAGSRCCPNGLGSRREDVCFDGGEKCPACEAPDCGELLCDGPEDCPSAQFCCWSKDGFCRSNADCTPGAPTFEQSSWTSTECQTRCVGDQRDPDHGAVVCKDDRDCPGPYMAGRCRPLNSSELPFGIKVCSGTGT